MGWSIGEFNGRDIGYGVPATCDHPGCCMEIDRGLSYVCGGQPYGGDHGCGLFFCRYHVRIAGQMRDHARLCFRCYSNKPAFEPTPDVAVWVEHKLTHKSWQQWRDENPEKVAEMRRTLL